METKKADIGFFQEQQPNNLIANSLMRLMVFIPLIVACLYLLITQYLYYGELNQLLRLLEGKLIDRESFVTITATLKNTDYVIFSTLIGIAFGGKVIQKAQESKSIKDELGITTYVPEKPAL